MCYQIKYCPFVLLFFTIIYPALGPADTLLKGFHVPPRALWSWDSRNSFFLLTYSSMMASTSLITFCTFVSQRHSVYNNAKPASKGIARHADLSDLPLAGKLW